MVMKTLSIDLRKRIVGAYDANEGTRQEIADRFKVSLAMVKKLLEQRKRLGTIEPQSYRCGRKPILQEQDLQWLRQMVTKRPDITLKELQQLCSKQCSIMTISRCLEQLGASYKKNRWKPPNKSVRILFGNGISGEKPLPGLITEGLSLLMNPVQRQIWQGCMGEPLVVDE